MLRTGGWVSLSWEPVTSILCLKDAQNEALISKHILHQAVKQVLKCVYIYIYTSIYMFQLLVSWWFPLEHIPKMWLSRDSKWTFFTGISFYNSGATLPSLSLLLLVGTPQGRLKQPLFFLNPVESTFVVDKSRWILNLRRFLGIVIVDEHFLSKERHSHCPNYLVHSRLVI